jgi:uncharacterized protein YbjT (DUF2867 family)
MKILVIGASHGIGLEAVRACLSKGHVVTAFSRHPESITFNHPNLRLYAGDVLDQPRLADAVSGQDVVICTLGLKTLQAIGPPLTVHTGLLSRGTSNILAAMGQAGLKRIIVVTAISCGDSAQQCSWVARVSLHMGLRQLFTEKNRQETLLEASSTNWTIIRPTALTNGPKTDKTTNQTAQLGLFSYISRRDVAARIEGLLDDSSSYGRAINLSYEPRLGDSVRWLKDYYSRKTLEVAL